MSTHAQRLKELPEKPVLRPLKEGEKEVLETLAFFGRVRGSVETIREWIKRVDTYLNGAGVPIMITIIMLGIILIVHFSC